MGQVNGVKVNTAAKVRIPIGKSTEEGHDQQCHRCKKESKKKSDFIRAFNPEKKVWSWTCLKCYFHSK